MDVYRICRAGFRALDGEGARLYGGRWNSPGRSVVYTSATLALAALEYLVHVETTTAPRDLVALKIEVPNDAPVQEIATGALRPGWEREFESVQCKQLGNAWVDDGRSLALRVPAAPVSEEFNVLLNPRHDLMRRVRLVAERPFSFDPRLL